MILGRSLGRLISRISRRICLNENRMAVPGTPRVYASRSHLEGIRAWATTFQIRVRRGIADDCKRQRRHAIIPNFSNYRFIPRRLRASTERKGERGKGKGGRKRINPGNKTRGWRRPNRARSARKTAGRNKYSPWSESRKTWRDLIELKFRRWRARETAVHRGESMGLAYVSERRRGNLINVTSLSRGWCRGFADGFETISKKARSLIASAIGGIQIAPGPI